MDSTIISNIRINDRFYYLTVRFKKYKKVLPGQFVMIKVSNSIEPLLRRPMSICDADYRNNTLDILYQIAGKGTKILSEKIKGDNLDISKPFGVGFKLKSNISNAVFVGGGVGIAPFLLFAKKIKEAKKDINITAFIGGRSKEDVLLKNELREQGCTIIVSTENGTLGKKGLVTKPLENYLKNNNKNSIIFSCGPNKMMMATSKLARKYNISCQVSLDERMACGIGVCMGCVIKFKENNSFSYKCACKDGPVFDSKDVLWE